MWVSSSILSLTSSRLNHCFTRTKAFGYLWSRTFSLASLANSNPIFQSDFGKLTYFWSRNHAFDAGICSIKHFGEDFDNVLKNIDVPSDCVETIRNVLMKHSWINSYESGFSTELDQYNVIRILDNLFEETLDASIALYFFRWSELWIGVEHSSKPISRMIHILVSGNRSFKAVDMLLCLVEKYGGEKLCSVMNDLFETRIDHRVLETVYSMLIDCCIIERKVDVANKNNNSNYIITRNIIV